MFDVNAAYEGSHGMSGNEQVEDPPEPQPWPSSTISAHLAQGAQKRRDAREAATR